MSGAAVPSLVPLNGALTSLDGAVTAGAVAVTSSGDTADRVLPVRDDIATVLPRQGLRRGSTVAIHGSGSLLLALLSAATSNGSWAAVVGLPGLGLLAAREAGVAVERLALVPRPGAALATVAGALLDGMDLVALAGNISGADARKLSARARHRRSVLLSFGPWPGADVELRCTSARWHGIGDGHGYLREREITLLAGGRGAAARPRTTTLLLPGIGDPNHAARRHGKPGRTNEGGRLDEVGRPIRRAAAG